MAKPFLIVNPAAGKGKFTKRWDSLLAEIHKIFPKIEWAWTEDVGSATALTRKALKEGYDFIIAAGGDGTLSECVNGFIKNDVPVNPRACLGLLPLGRGSDLSRTLDIPRKFDEALAVLAQKKSRKLDIGKCVCTSSYGKPLTRYFINIANVGLVSEVVDHSHKAPSFLGASGAYIYGALRGIWQYEAKSVRYSWKNPKGIAKGDCSLLNMIIANGAYFGSGMRAAPQARIDDGLFDILIGPRVKLWRFLVEIPGFYSGKHASNPYVKRFTTSQIEISGTEPDQKIPVEMDGDSLGYLPARFEVLPACLNFIC